MEVIPPMTRQLADAASYILSSVALTDPPRKVPPMLNSSRTLASALVLVFIACSTFVGCGGTVPPEPTDVVKRHSSAICGEPWGFTASMAMKRHKATATRLDDGSVIMAGGYWFNPFDDTIPPSLVNPAERFIPDTHPVDGVYANDSWVSAGNLNVPRYFHQAAGLKDANGRVTKVLVVGGVDGSGLPTNTAEIYDSADNSWHQVASMATARMFPQLTVLSD